MSAGLSVAPRNRTYVSRDPLKHLEPARRPRFWTFIALALIAWGAAFFYDFTFGGFIHLIPVAAVSFVIYRRMARDPNTDYGRWRPPPKRRDSRWD